jgi:hypothetical protein
VLEPCGRGKTLYRSTWFLTSSSFLPTKPRRAQKQPQKFPEKFAQLALMAILRWLKEGFCWPEFPPEVLGANGKSTGVSEHMDAHSFANAIVSADLGRELVITVPLPEDRGRRRRRAAGCAACLRPAGPRLRERPSSRAPRVDTRRTGAAAQARVERYPQRHNAESPRTSEMAFLSHGSGVVAAVQVHRDGLPRGPLSGLRVGALRSGYWLGPVVHAAEPVLRGSLLFALAAAALASCTPSPRDDLAGTWETHLTVDDACGFEAGDLPAVMPIGSSCGNQGTWRWEFTPIADRRGTDERWYDFDAWHSGVLEVHGKLAVTATALTIADEGGRSSCLIVTRQSGRYEWSVRDNELRLTLVSDPCIYWRAVVTKRTWVKVN